ncbi:Protein trichome birefringence-like 34 [Raphanus sativus]|uniref:Protein trichome birefringence-like 34 n=1 Tax=Raphanus sativus TaxID=3726 RepID=A0A9W3DJ47_RAPSA|nr:protein trichome birefringence-like 34 [Raphanus sativus]KAJ4903854.1 Protein trichome birefringence-like 34 [Raphanus sativus]
MAKRQLLILGIRASFHTLAAVLVAGVIFTALFLSRNGMPKENPQSEGVSNVKEGEGSDRECNLFEGKWVFDNESNPIYKEEECKFMSDQLACGKFGRKDSSYKFWRWQPHKCDLPRFNGTKLLERLRNKRMVYVGDSLNRGQWVSMVCMASSVITNPKMMYFHSNGSNLITFKSLEYNATIDFYWAPLMVESNSDDPTNHRLPERIVRIQSIEKHARHWTESDIIVLNSYLWWLRPHMKTLWGSFEKLDGIYKEVEMVRVYEMALQTMSQWLEVHVNSNLTKLFFMSMSPTHERAEEWGGKNKQNCYGETSLIDKEGYHGKGSDPKMMIVVENVLDELKRRGLNMHMINITQLSEYRKDGHPSIYRKQWEPLKKSQVLDPSSYSDCIHWCLPGVPDVWNQLLYAYIIDDHKSN